ncbi:MAG TPA: polysaccharide biosynthesis tyrosine autokinase, partial [Candidatus Brocadiales bacterium]|nr:polysaccharide biosynthesis tyrosine autokinase [Candidatus Brocadiales bacterium]
LGRLKADHPAALRIKSRMETIKQMMDARVKRFKDGMELECKQALAKEEELRGKLGELKKEMLVIAKKTVPYKSLEREVKANTELYNGLLQRMKEAGVSSGIKTTNVQIVDRAEIPKDPYKPNKKLNILLAMLVGLTCGTGLAFFLDYLDNTVKSPDDVENRIKLPLLGFVPAIENGTGDTFRKDLIAHYELRSSASEAYRTIRTGVLFSSPDKKVHSILVTSAYPTEGKTITAVNLATVLAQGSDSVLLVDADLRRPRIHKTFKIDNAKGLTNLLIGEASMDEVIQKSPVENLYILPSGPIPPNPSELLSSKSMDELIEKLKGKYARIVFDSSPMVAVTDARIIATKVDGCICVIHAAKSDIRGTKRAKEQLEDIGGRFIGAVLNNVSMDRRTYYGYYYRYGYYHHYYGEDEKKNT